ncbi:MAG: tubulin-like protein [Methanobrevibacter olleyae]|uniref:Tubulin-like protein n=1 Tax=Methanobrevibacter olleyae TaxID=294671 RepID=A0A8T3VP51_METOL|nr:tubulin-like protein [Methanobrevibacter olleyae]
MEKSNSEIENSENAEDLSNIENIAYIDINGTKMAIELLDSQKYENVEAIPIKSDFFGKKDFITLKKGYEMDLVEIKELENSTVNTVLCKNDSVVPLILIDDDEITGAMQNRIINDTLLIPAQSSINIHVSCTEHGRWHTRGEGEASRTFKPSLYSANHSTRSRKSRASYEERDYQGEVWDSISEFESRSNFKSMTSALNDSYENLKDKQNDYLSKFHIEDGQNGVIFIVNGELKGLELFYNHRIYKEYHEKLCRSYIIEAIVEKKSVDNIDRLELMNLLENISQSEFKSKKSIGLGDNIKFSNDFGSGSGLIWEDELIHMTFFKDFVINEVII